MKSFTDIEQSKKLAEILPRESADQTWERIAISGANLDVPEEMEYWHNGNTPCILNSKIGIPCWSFTALFKLLPKCIEGAEPSLIKTFRDDYRIVYDIYGDENITSKDYTNPIDACVEMIFTLKQRNLI